MLKKHSLKGLAASFLIAAVFFSGCKTVPEETAVNPLDLLDNESAFYMAIPVSVDPELAVRFIQNNVKNISEKNAELIASRISNVYCGLNHKKNKTSVQLSMNAEIGNVTASKLFTEKNGWQNNKVSLSAKSVYDVYEQKNISLCFPSESLALIGRDIPVMLSQYEVLKNSSEENPSHLIDDEVYDYLAGAEEEIRFYAGKPQSFLTLLTGANLNLQLDCVTGSFVCDPKYPKQYILNLDFKFKTEAFLKAGKTLLTLAFGLTNSNAEIIDNTELKISGILISKESLYKILIL